MVDCSVGGKDDHVVDKVERMTYKAQDELDSADGKGGSSED